MINKFSLPIIPKVPIYLGILLSLFGCKKELYPQAESRDPLLTGNWSTIKQLTVITDHNGIVIAQDTTLNMKIAIVGSSIRLNDMITDYTIENFNGEKAISYRLIDSSYKLVVFETGSDTMMLESAKVLENGNTFKLRFYLFKN